MGANNTVPLYHHRILFESLDSSSPSAYSSSILLTSSTVEAVSSCGNAVEEKNDTESDSDRG
eukprot:scaffold1813_cov185-Alexandrium_tamarense.AAC.13